MYGLTTVICMRNEKHNKETAPTKSLVVYLPCIKPNKLSLLPVIYSLKGTCWLLRWHIRGDYRDGRPVGSADTRREGRGLNSRVETTRKKHLAILMYLVVNSKTVRSKAENCSLLGTDNFREDIFTPNQGYCLEIPWF